MMKVNYYVFCLFLLQFQSIYCQVLIDTTSLTDNYKSTENIENKVIRYYFFPNLDAYYDIKFSVFIYKQNGEWIKKERIPSNYRGYSLFNNFKVTITDYFGEYPFESILEHRKKFPANFTGRKKPSTTTHR